MQRNFTKNRTNRRVRKVSYEGVNKRKGFGRRKHERYSHYIMITAPILAILIVSIIAYNVLA